MQAYPAERKKAMLPSPEAYGSREGRPPCLSRALAESALLTPELVCSVLRSGVVRNQGLLAVAPFVACTPSEAPLSTETQTDCKLDRSIVHVQSEIRLVLSPFRCLPFAFLLCVCAQFSLHHHAPC